MLNVGSRRTVLLAAAAALILLAGVYVAHPSGASAASQATLVVRTAKSKALGKTILVNLKGRSLYSLSAEKNGRFICTDVYCRSLWTPLVVSRGTKPTGSKLLGTVRRPDGRTQVTYRGLPLYTFNEDRKPGDVKGNGFKDVGTWLVATSSRASTSTGGGGGYRYQP